jgi:hypothetical protein
MRALVILLVVGACDGPPSTASPVGSWKRSSPDAGIIDQLDLAADGTFSWTSQVWGSSGTAVGRYTVTDDRMTLTGETTFRGEFTLTTTFAIDDELLALGAYVPGTDGPRYRALWRWIDADIYVDSWTVSPEIWMHEGSFLVSWIDPIWDKRKSFGGDYVETEDQLVLGHATFRRLDDGVAIAGDVGRSPGLYHHPTWHDTSLLFVRRNR